MTPTNAVNVSWAFIQKYSFIAILALATFCWNTNEKINSITDNKEDISILRDKQSKQWQRYSELNKSLVDLRVEVAGLRSELKHLNFNHQ